MELYSGQLREQSSKFNSVKFMQYPVHSLSRLNKKIKQQQVGKGAGIVFSLRNEDRDRLYARDLRHRSRQRY